MDLKESELYHTSDFLLVFKTYYYSLEEEECAAMVHYWVNGIEMSVKQIWITLFTERMTHVKNEKKI